MHDIQHVLGPIMLGPISMNLLNMFCLQHTAYTAQGNIF